jgi:hypothetical protein
MTFLQNKKIMFNYQKMIINEIQIRQNIKLSITAAVKKVKLVHHKKIYFYMNYINYYVNLIRVII